MSFLDPYDVIIELIEEPLEQVFGAITDVLTTVNYEITSLADMAETSLESVGVDVTSLSNLLLEDGEGFLTSVFDEGVLSYSGLMNSLESMFEQLASGLVADVFGSLTDITADLEFIAPDIVAQVKTSLDGAFDGLKGVFDSIAIDIETVLNSLAEEFSFFNLSIQQFGLNLISQLKGLFDIDVDELTRTMVNINKRMLELRAEELGVR